MEFSWFIISLLTVSICLFFKAVFIHLSPQPKLPPGPPNIPIISTLQWVCKSFADLEPILLRLHSKYGLIVSLSIAGHNAIFISSNELAQKALVTHGSTFIDRPPPPVAIHLLSCNQHNINSAAYGPLWRLLRRNLTSEILHPSRVKSYAHARKWVLDILISKLKQESNAGRPVCVMDHFQYAMFCLLVFMCFGEKLDNGVIREVESIEREILRSYSKFNILNSLPKLSKVLFRKRWSLLYQLRSKQESVLIPLIRARKENKNKDGVVAYVDTLLNLSLPGEGGRKLNEGEIVSLCSEFLTAGTDSTSTGLEWIMANLVKHQDIQAKLFNETSANNQQGGIEEDDLQKMPYLKVVILEGLRRHPPGHFLIPHVVTEDTQLEGYMVPRDATVNVLIAEMGLNPKVLEEPLVFRPERFMRSENTEVFDITGSREIKMMPFGAGRRICPGYGLAILHLEYFVANLVKEFEWKAVKGDGVDLSEILAFTVVMKNPLWACITSRQG